MKLTSHLAYGFTPVDKESAVFDGDFNAPVIFSVQPAQPDPFEGDRKDLVMIGNPKQAN